MAINPRRVTHLFRSSPAALALNAPAPDERHNFLLGVINGGLFDTGMAFLGTATVIPAYVSALHGSEVAVGLAAAILVSGWPLPQLFVAPYMRCRASALGIYRLGGATRSLFLLLAVLATFLLAGTHPHSALILFMVGITGFSVAGGVGGIAFTELVARTVPSNRRSSFFSQRLLWGSIGALAAGWVVRQILGEASAFPFPQNYGILFGLAWLITAIAISLFAFVREPKLAPVAGWEPLPSYLAHTLRLVGRDQRYKRYLLVATLAASHQMAVPFYTLTLLNKNGNSGEGVLGILIAAQVCGGVVSNLFWGRMGDHNGSRVVLSRSIMMTTLAPAWALWAAYMLDSGTGLWHSSAVLGAVLFAILGVVNSGAVVAANTYMLDICPPEHRTTYIGFTNTFSGLYGLYPIIGGVLAARWGGSSLFTLTLLLQVAAVLAVRTLPKQPV